MHFFMIQLSVIKVFQSHGRFSKKLHLSKPKWIHFAFAFQTDSIVLGIEDYNLYKLLSNYSADAEKDNKTKYVYFIVITDEEIEKK